MYKVSVGLFDRLVSFISYVTAGLGGMIYCVLMYFQKKLPSKFVRFNVFQSIFVSLLYFVAAVGFGWILKLLAFVPFINYLAAQISFLFNRQIFFEYSLIQTFMIGLILYMAIVSLFGRYPRVYWISRIIDKQL